MQNPGTYPVLSCSIQGSKIDTFSFKTYMHIMNLHKEKQNNVGQVPCCCLLAFFFSINGVWGFFLTIYQQNNCFKILKVLSNPLSSY